MTGFLKLAKLTVAVFAALGVNAVFLMTLAMLNQAPGQSTQEAGLVVKRLQAPKTEQQPEQQEPEPEPEIEEPEPVPLDLVKPSTPELEPPAPPPLAVAFDLAPAGMSSLSMNVVENAPVRRQFQTEMGQNAAIQTVVTQSRPRRRQVHDEGSVDKSPRPLRSNRRPGYPRVARRRRWRGSVTVRMLVDAVGRVERCQIVASSHKCFASAVDDVVRQWRFTPAEFQGRAVKCWVRKTYDFKP